MKKEITSILLQFPLHRLEKSSHLKSNIAKARQIDFFLNLTKDKIGMCQLLTPYRCLDGEGAVFLVANS